MLPVVFWWLVVQLFGLAILPLTWRLFARLPGRGYPLAKALGLLLAAYVLWLGVALHVLPNSLGGAVVSLLVAGARPGGWAVRGFAAVPMAFVRWSPGCAPTVGWC